jgi:hypothetical protein
MAIVWRLHTQCVILSLLYRSPVSQTHSICCRDVCGRSSLRPVRITLTTYTYTCIILCFFTLSARVPRGHCTSSIQTIYINTAGKIKMAF